MYGLRIFLSGAQRAATSDLPETGRRRSGGSSSNDSRLSGPLHPIPPSAILPALRRFPPYDATSLVCYKPGSLEETDGCDKGPHRQANPLKAWESGPMRERNRKKTKESQGISHCRPLSSATHQQRTSTLLNAHSSLGRAGVKGLAADQGCEGSK